MELLVEKLTIRWIANYIESTDIKNVGFAGGVFMNVKANMLIQNLPEVKSMYVMPSSGDESLSLGAALHCYYEKTNDTISVRVIYFNSSSYH